MLTPWELQLIEFRRTGAWDAAYDLLEEVAATAVGLDVARVKLQTAHTRFDHSPRHALRSLDLLDQALCLAGDDIQVQIRCLILGLTCSQYVTDSDRTNRFLRRAAAVCASDRSEVGVWHGRLLTLMGSATMSMGKPRQATKLFSASVSWHKSHTGPYSEHDRLCQLRIARTGLAECLWETGRRSEAGDEFRRAKNTATDGAACGLHYLDGRIATAEERWDHARFHLYQALATSSARDHLFKLRAATALVMVLRQDNRWTEIRQVLDPLRQEAMEGRLIRVLYRLQRLALPAETVGGEVVGC